MESPEPKIITITGKSASGLPLYGKLAPNPSSRKLICFMPAANSRKVNRDPLQLTRLTWHEDLPELNVLAIADPSMSINNKLSGAWYLHPTHDVIEEISEFIVAQISLLGVEPHDVLFYGSSLGGFGALALASTLEGSSAIAEVPQIKVSNWPFPGAIKSMEDYILGTSFPDFEKLHPHQVNLQSRFWKSGRIPDLRILTNNRDNSYQDQIDFIESLKKLPLKRIGEQKLFETPNIVGHKPLDRGSAIGYIKQWSE